MTVALLLFAPAILIGWLVVRMLLGPAGRAGWMNTLLEISLGAGVGLGIVSILFFVLLWANAAGRAVVLTSEIALAACAVWLSRRRRTTQPEAAPAGRSSWIWLLRAAALLTLFLFALDAGRSIEANPHGGWDAFSIWNLKAKFLTAGPGGWRNAMAPVAGGALFGANHPGYPLLLPSAVASAWKIQGETSAATPALLGALFAFATAAILCGGIAWLRGEASGLLALLLLLSSDGFASQLASQVADIPLSLFLLAALTLTAIAAEQAWPREALLLAGFCCGLAAWTKNEGLPFCILAVAMVAWRGGRKAASWMAVGAAPAVVLLAAFKILLVHNTEAMFPRTLAEGLSKLADPSRCMQIAAAFGQSIWAMGVPWAHPLLLAAILAATLGLAPRPVLRRQIWQVLPITGLLATDFVAYLITTADLTWQLGTSNLRLLVQVWPSLLFLTFLAIQPPAVPIAAPPVKGKRERRRAASRALAR